MTSYNANERNLRMTTTMQWRRSSYCANGACLEVARSADVLVRDSKLDDSPILRFSPQSWKAFTEGVRAGDFSA